ncbi:MAG: CAP domain-containing protein [Actinomycetota bacterium]
MRSNDKAAHMVAVVLVFILAVLLVGGCLDVGLPQGEDISEEEAAAVQAELQGQIEHVASNAPGLATTIHDLINEERRQEGLRSLQWDQSLARIAFDHSKDMAERDYFDHLSPEGEDFADRYTEHDYHKETRVGDTVYVGGENLSLTNVVRSYTYDPETGQVHSYEFNDLEELARSTVQGWMDSPGHRENILTPFTREGIGIYVTAEGEVYITENFS